MTMTFTNKSQGIENYITAIKHLNDLSTKDSVKPRTENIRDKALTLNHELIPIYYPAVISYTILVNIQHAISN